MIVRRQHNGILLAGDDPPALPAWGFASCPPWTDGAPNTPPSAEAGVKARCRWPPGKQALRRPRRLPVSLALLGGGDDVDLARLARTLGDPSLATGLGIAARE